MSHKAILFLVAVVLLFMMNVLGGGVVSAEITTSQAQQSTAPNLCQDLPTHSNPVTIPTLAQPAHLTPFTDPAFSSTITRISNAQSGGVIKTAYNTIQAWNADESRLILYHTGSETRGHHLYDGQSYAYIRLLPIAPVDLEQFFWDNDDPNTLYYVSEVSPNIGKLIRYNVNSDQKTVLHDFSDVCGAGSYPHGGNDVQMMSWDSDLIGLRCGNASSANPVDLTFYYRLSTDAVSSTITIGNDSSYEPWYAAQPAPSGNKLLLGPDVLDLNMNVLRSIDIGKPEHESLGQLANGHDALFRSSYSPEPNGCDGSSTAGVGQLVVHDLDNGSCRVVIGEANGYGYPPSGTHPSAVGYDAPGWVTLSSVGYGQLDTLTSGQPAPILVSEIYLANTDPDNQTICRVAHHRTHGKERGNENYAGYFGEPHPIISPSGTRILFSSDWHNSGAVNTYVIELPVHSTTSPTAVTQTGTPQLAAPHMAARISLFAVFLIIFSYFLESR